MSDDNNNTIYTIKQSMLTLLYKLNAGLTISDLNN